MRIRTKLLILLLALSLGPMLVATWRSYRATDGLGHTLADKTGAAVAADLIDELERIIHFGGVILTEQKNLVDAWLVAQEAALRDALFGPAHSAAVSYFGTDFDTGSVPGLEESSSRFRVQSDGSFDPVTISREHPVIVLAPDTAFESVSDSIPRLGGMQRFYRSFRQLALDRYYWTYASLDKGIHVSYPGHGGFGAHYDARLRPWYRNAADTDRTVWSDPYTDATTGVAMLTASRAVRDDGGSLLGVVGIDITIQSLLDKLYAGKSRVDADVFIISPQPARAETGELSVYARLDRDDTAQEPGRRTRSISSTHPEFGPLHRDVVARSSGVRRLDFEGEDSLWAYSPLDEGAALLAIVPYREVETAVSDVRAAVGRETRGALEMSALGTLVLLLVVVGVSVVGAQRVTVRIRSLAAAARRLAAGDFNIHVPVTPGDEIGELGATFNTVAPKLLDRIEARNALSHLGRYFSPNLAEELTRNASLLNLGGERREVTSLFTDLAGFTSVVERTDPSVIVPVLNGYLDGMARIVFDYEGTIDKVIGDAVHALFNAPFDQPDHADRAIRCAMAMDEFSESYRKQVRQDGVPLGITRIGINSGVATVGNFGGEVLFDYTAHGDTINTAARLESLNRYVGTRILVSEHTASRADNFHGRPVGEVVLKGRAAPLQIYEPLAASDFDSTRVRAYCDGYASIAAAAPDAPEIFRNLAAAYPSDPLVRFHLDRLQAGDTGTRIVMQTK